MARGRGRGRGSRGGRGGRGDGPRSSADAGLAENPDVLAEPEGQQGQQGQPEADDDDDTDIAASARPARPARPVLPAVPHTVAEAARRAFHPSGATLRLGGEADRRLRAEAEAWRADAGLAPRLATLALEELAALPADEALATFDGLRALDGDGRCHALRLLEVLAPDLPLARAVAAIPDGVYWRRRALHTWPDGCFPQCVAIWFPASGSPS